jgi:hypothetical protein
MLVRIVKAVPVTITDKTTISAFAGDTLELVSPADTTCLIFLIASILAIICGVAHPLVWYANVVRFASEPPLFRIAI